MRARIKAAACALVAAAAIGAATVPGRAYELAGPRWVAGRSILIQMQIGATRLEELFDGNNRWNDVGAGAALAWNNLADVSLNIEQDSTAPVGIGNGFNNAFFSRTVYGEPFGSGVIAYTLLRYPVSTGVVVEADVIFDTAQAWNSYRGAVRRTSGGEILHDIRRVAIHEFGHVLGLNHPDEAGQSVPALMNSRITDTDSLQADDINGVRAIYGAAVPVPDRLAAGARMAPGQWLASANTRYRLYMQGDSNLVVYDMTTGEALWWTGASAANGQAIFQSDGNFVVYDGGGAPIWFTGTAGNPGAFMVLQNDGNLVLYSAAGVAVWHRLM